MTSRIVPFCFLVFLPVITLCAQGLELNRSDATVWHPGQDISGILRDCPDSLVQVHHNDSVFSVSVRNRNFSFHIALDNGENMIWVSGPSEAMSCFSDTITLTLGYRPLPLVVPVALVEDDRVLLTTRTMENPRKLPLTFEWTPDKNNPAATKIFMRDASTGVAKIPHRDGDYFFDLLVRTPVDSVTFRTYVTRRGNDIVPFDIENGHAAWIDTAVIYQITPNAFVRGGSYDDVTAKLPEIRHLGINTIYLQPVYSTSGGGQGYDIIDYFSLRPDLGTERQLHTLITSAKKLGLRVLFDFVPNHTSIHHPYAKFSKELGQASHYYDYYQHTLDGKKYSSAYHKDGHGFIYYFWEDLVNLNYDNHEVQRWILEACKHWVRKFDIDGYRFDAVWGVNARKPSFGRRLRRELKSIKPDIFLLAEDKPGLEVFDSGFDAAYDWTSDTSWVSQVSWQYEYREKESMTVFNHPKVEKRAAMLADAIFNSGNPGNLVLRFMENNDLPRFGIHHNPSQEKMVAALLFSLPGIPLLYNGQEVGVKAHPYTKHSVFRADQSIRSQSPGLFDYYQKLIRLRRKYPALNETVIAPVPDTGSPFIFGFTRGTGSGKFLILLNLGDKSAEAAIDVGMSFSTMVDILTGDEIIPNARGERMTLSLDPYSTRWLQLR